MFYFSEVLGEHDLARLVMVRFEADVCAVFRPTIASDPVFEQVGAPFKLCIVLFLLLRVLALLFCDKLLTKKHVNDGVHPDEFLIRSVSSQVYSLFCCGRAGDEVERGGCASRTRYLRVVIG